MKVIDTIRYMGDRVQIAMVVGLAPTDGSGKIKITYANTPASDLFGYNSNEDMINTDVRSLMPPDIANDHQDHVAGYVVQTQAKGGTVMMRANKSRVMGAWRNLQGIRLDGSAISIQVHVADIKNEQERYFVAFFRDRTEEEDREGDLAEALEKAHKAGNDAQKSIAQLEEARAEAEAGLQRQETLSNQVSLLLDNLGTRRGGDGSERRNMGTGFDRRQMYVILLFSIIAMGLATVIFEGVPTETLHVAERILLVLTGAVAALTAGVLDPRNKE